jgi:hypothetical protein
MTQLNIYKWLVETVKGTPVVGLQICAIVKDYSPYDTSEGYPEAEAIMIDIRDARDPRTERHAALELAGQQEMQRLQDRWPTDPQQLAPWLRAPRERADRAAYATAVSGYRGKPVAAWRLVRAVAVLALFAFIGVLLAWRG